MVSIIQGGAILGLVVALFDVAMGIGRDKSKLFYKSEIFVTGLGFASVQFRFSALLMDDCSPFFFILFLPSLFLLGPAMYALTLRVLAIERTLWFWHARLSLLLLIVLCLYEGIIFVGDPAAITKALLAKEQNHYFWVSIVCGVFTLSHYFAAWFLFIQTRHRLGLSFVDSIFWALLLTILGALLLLVGFVIDLNLVSVVGCMLFVGVMAIIILSKVRHPDLLSDINRTISETRYKNTSLESIDLAATFQQIEMKLVHHRLFSEPQLRLADLAREVGISPHQLSRIINEKMGRNFNSFINKFRLDEAKNLLTNSKKTITEISFEVGFNNLTSFNTQFRKRYGSSPREYRRSRQSSK